MADAVNQARVEAEGELALARLALHDNELGHAASHAANSIALDPTLPDVYELLQELAAASGSPLDLFPDGDGAISLGTAVARAQLLAAAGSYDDAVGLLAAAAAHEPAKPWAQVAWLQRPGLAERLDPERLTGALARLALRLPDPVPEPDRAPLMPFLELARRVVELRADQPFVHWGLSGLARRLGAVDEAIDWCVQAERAEPSPMAAMMLGYALRSAGREAETERAWLRALERDPGNLDLHVDLGELLAQQGRLAEGLAWLERALAVDPDHGKAFPSASAMRFLRDQDVSHLVALADHWRAHPEHSYAPQMLESACQGRTWLSIVPAPGEAVANALASFVKEYPDLPEDEPLSGSVTLSALEPPSAIAALQRYVPELEVGIESVPEPDGRNPGRPVTYRVWRYEGRRAVAAVPAPPPQAAQALYRVARRWWPHPPAAYDEAVQLAGLPLEHLLGLLAHVPPYPRDDATWADLHRQVPALWPRFAQAWTCLGIAHHRTDEPWPQSTRRQVLLDLVNGPEDWVCDAALNAMVVTAWVDPEIREEVAMEVSRRFVDAVEIASQRSMTILDSLAHLTLATPSIPGDEITSLARRVLELPDDPTAAPAPDPGQDRRKRRRRLFGRS
jgi:tetratricopeptide (TPR) repeat protein